MDPTTRKALTSDLSRLTSEIAAALRPAMLAAGPVRTRAQKLWADERVGDPFDVWTDLLSRRAAVLWVLKSLYVRVLEDRGLLRPSRIVDPEGQALFAYLARDLGDTAYLRWVYRDLASAKGGLPELFAPQPAELVLPPDALSQKLIEFWRKRDLETGELTYRFDQEHFDGRLMGDLYQDLDPVVKKRYALLQTPEFIIDFILDETLTPAIAEFGIETVKLLDPACGSGHFLLAAFKRLFTGMREKFPKRPVGEVVADVLARVVGIDLNDYACALARARLVMTALEACGDSDLGGGSNHHPQIHWADALEQVECEDVGQLGLFDDQRPKALLTRPEVRKALGPILRQGFHVVVGNPPFDSEKDQRRKEYHKERVGRDSRYLAARGGYTLAIVFTERAFQLAAPRGHIGLVVASSFMRREFGKSFVERVLAKKHLTSVIDMSGIGVRGAGVPAVLIFARQASPTSELVRVVMSKKGEPNVRPDAVGSRAWAQVLDGHMRAGYEEEFISVADVARSVLARHPWSLGGGGAAELKRELDRRCTRTLGNTVSLIGFGAVTREDEVFQIPFGTAARWGIETCAHQPSVSGEDVRNWAVQAKSDAVFPYGSNATLPQAALGRYMSVLWRYRTQLWLREGKGFKTKRDSGGQYYEYSMFYPERHFGNRLAFAEVATNNNFVLDDGSKVFGQTAPLIILSAGATETDYLVLAAQLNSSCVDFWCKQVFHSHGDSKAGARVTGAPWEDRYQRDGTKLRECPLMSVDDVRLGSFARRLDALARDRVAESAGCVVKVHATQGPAALRASLGARRERDLARLFQMVALQEELDWLCYKLYGIDPDAEIREPGKVASFRPGFRPFEITLAQEDADRLAAISRGEEPDEQPTAWFTRHGWEPYLSLDSLSPDDRRIAEARIERTAANRDLALVEQPTYKRRWYMPKYEEEEREAMDLWLADKIEAWTKDRKEPFTVRQATAALRSDPGLLAVGELLTGRADFDVETLVGDRIRADAVPNLKHHVFKPDGLHKRAAWEETWRLQHEEDAGKIVTPPVPPKYERTDYLKGEYWSLRGKLDVPKERFIAFTEVPPPAGEELLYGWAGWTHRERAQTLLALDEQLEAAGIKVPDRYGVLYGVWFLLPYVAWDAPDAARDFRADVKSLVGDAGVTEAMLNDWAERFPLTKPRAKKAKKT